MLNLSRGGCRVKGAAPLPVGTRVKYWLEGTREEDGLDRAIGDFLCGMTDRYAMRLYQELRLPKPWTVY